MQPNSPHLIRKIFSMRVQCGRCWAHPPPACLRQSGGGRACSRAPLSLRYWAQAPNTATHPPHPLRANAQSEHINRKQGGRSPPAGWPTDGVCQPPLPHQTSIAKPTRKGCGGRRRRSWPSACADGQDWSASATRSILCAPEARQCPTAAEGGGCAQKETEILICIERVQPLVINIQYGYHRKKSYAYDYALYKEIYICHL